MTYFAAASFTTREMLAAHGEEPQLDPQSAFPCFPSPDQLTGDGNPSEQDDAAMASQKSIHRGPDNCVQTEQKLSIDPRETLRRPDDTMEEPSFFVAGGAVYESNKSTGPTSLHGQLADTTHENAPDSSISMLPDGQSTSNPDELILHYPPIPPPPPPQNSNPPTPEDPLADAQQLLRPHPCTAPLPASLAAQGITRTTRVFLTDVLPPTYPFLPFRTAHSTTLKFQIPFFTFSGPDPPPPPAALGASAGDMYVAPAAHALYGCTRVADGGDATWTPWRVVGWEPTPEVPLGSGSGTGTPKHGREVKLTDPGLLRHPYFPAQVMWMHNACFGWYALKTVNNLGREAHMRELLKGWKDAGQAARVLVAHTLKKAAEKLAAAAERKGKGRERKRGVKRRASALEDEDEGEDHGDGEGQRYGDDEEEEKPRVKKQQQNRASNPTGLVLQIPAPTTTTTPPVAAPRSVNDWDAYYARPRANSTRTTKELRDQAAVIARLEAENAALKGELEAQGAAVEQHKKENEALREVMPRQEEGRGASPNTGTHDKVAGQERMPFHPEFLDFMRTTFASEVMKGCNSQRIAAESAATDAKLEVAALQCKLAAELNATMDIDGGGDNIDKPSAAETKTIAQVVAARLKDRQDYVLRTAQHTVALRAAETTICELEDKIKELNRDRGQGPPDTAALDRANVCIAEQNSRILGLEAEVARLTRYADEETDLLRRLLKVREGAKERAQEQTLDEESRSGRPVEQG